MFERSHLLIVVLAAAAAGAGLLAGHWLRGGAALPPATGPAALATGERRPELRLPDVDGRPRELAEWDGKLLLVNFWASWCAPCREEMPLLERAQQQHGERGLQVVGIASDSAAATAAFLRDFPVAYPILVDDPDHGGDAAARFGDNRGALPYTVLVGRDGRVLARRFGNFSESALQAWLEPHL
jgi:thiol-disulfide isomerase/thioredoxin